jgi:hypothetical protein
VATVVPIQQVIPSIQGTRRDIIQACHTLRKQGQIEPLQVRVYHPAIDGKPAAYITFEQDVWGNAFVDAARQLGWPTMLIVEMTKYEA